MSTNAKLFFDNRNRFFEEEKNVFFFKIER